MSSAAERLWSDAFTLAIAQTEGKTQVLDVVRERGPPSVLKALSMSSATS